MQSTFPCGRFQLDVQRPQIMGIVNVTPDSFSDGGNQAKQQEIAIRHAFKLIEEGADILDIGGESTRPGSDPVSVDEELRRIVPVIKALKDCGVPLSIDTLKTEVMQVCLDLGVDLINDVYALRAKGAVELLARYPDAAICIMHMHGEPKTMQVEPPDYGGNITQAVKDFLQDRLAVMQEHGIALSRVLLDPGFGFGKTVAQNYELLGNMAQLQRLNLPILVGMSRKAMIAAVNPQTNPTAKERVYGSIALALAGIQNGAAIVRVHDVAATLQAVNTWQAIQNGV
ncbi:dihydropteroate synthase [Brackiella oedipodis]|uniref:dihydropteroate synthase n=1 Tax=Brackiella oedipodis TaxID=124225 RepID=UPI00048AF099|nr:dihydropteroate synthase [Brackiella oedipodis]